MIYHGRYPGASNIDIGLDVSEDLIEKYNLGELEPMLIKEAEEYMAYPIIYEIREEDDVLVLCMENPLYWDVYPEDPQCVEYIIVVNSDGRFKAVFGPTAYDVKGVFD